MTIQHIPWWETGIVYQIYPRSFQDSGSSRKSGSASQSGSSPKCIGDGVGDLQGILRRLPYLHDLGITAVWLSPIYPSPMVDFGYDVSNYTGIHPLFGTMADFDELLNALHQWDMKLILDFVPNHSSDQHPWFVESRSSRDNPKRDWYLWHDPKSDGSPPNNWPSYFGGPAWQWDEVTGQYYLHLFTKEQPDLNWRNPEVVDAMLNALRFWLEKGVDGFRVDVIWLVIKDALFRDDTPNPEWTPDRPIIESTLHDRSAGQPEVHDIIRKMRNVLDLYGDRVLVGEIYEPFEKLVTYYGRNLDECHLPFNFSLIDSPFNASAIKTCIEEYEDRLPQNAWPNWVLGNHDRERIVSPQRAGAERARLAQMLLLTLRGTPTMYYGDELGMINGEIPPEKIQDPQALNQSESGWSRDPERTPMQWDDSPYAGFSLVEPWLPVSSDYLTRNVKIQQADPTSTLNFVKNLIVLRQQSEALKHGKYMTLPVFTQDVLAYLRTEGLENILVVLNFSAQNKSANLASNSQKSHQILLSTYMDRDDEAPLNPLILRPYEGLIIRMTWS